MLNTPELRKRARDLGLTITTPRSRTKRSTKRSRRYKTNAELMTEILQTPPKIRAVRQNIKLKQLQNIIREGNKQMPKSNTNKRNNNYNKKRANILQE